MTYFQTSEDYQHYFYEEITKLRKDPQLDAYLELQFKQLTSYIEQITKETYWLLVPKLLGIEARLSIVRELLSFGEFSTQEVLDIVEKDYPHYFKELCGYDLSAKPKHSILFHLL